MFILRFILNLPKNIAVALIEGYQALLSPDHSWLRHRHPYGFCRHYPTCSQYTKEALVKFGFIKGVWLGSRRVLRCNPWADPKIDLIPN